MTLDTIRRHASGSLWEVVGILLLALAPFAPAAAQTTHDETKVKAAYVLRFVQYVEWPPAALPAGSPLVLGVAGADAIASELTQMVAGRSGQARPIVVRQVKAGDDMTGIHVLFIGNEEWSRSAQYVDAVASRPVLVITESAGALERGGMINFVTVDQRVKFEIALDRAEKAGLTVSSRLLAVAIRVHKG